MKVALDFEVWKKLLLNDCIALGKGREYDNLGDFVLRVLYDSGLDPTVKALVGKDAAEEKAS